MIVQYSLVIPCYNEEKTLPVLLQRLKECYGGTECYEVILVDNGSGDETPAILAVAVAEMPFVRTVRVPVNKGYGWGILQGLNVAQGEYLGWTHADMQTDPSDALEGFAKLQALGETHAFVKGRRYGRPIADMVFAVGMSFFDSILFGLPLWDINAQPTLFTRAFYQTWREPPNDFALDLFAYATAAKQKFPITRFPVLFGKRQHGISHWDVNWVAKLKFIKRTMNFSFALRKMWSQQ